MNAKQLRVFLVQGKKMVFDIRRFQKLFILHASEQNIGIGRYEEIIAGVLFVDKSAVHNWRMNLNGPGDVEKIQMLAKYWNIKTESLLMEVKDMSGKLNVEMELTDREKSALKSVYVSLLNYLKIYETTLGFCMNLDGTDYEYSQAYGLYASFKASLENEYIDLKKKLYDSLEEYVNGPLSCTLEDVGCYDDDDSPEFLKSEAMGMSEYLLNTFKEIIEPYLVA